MSEVRHPDSLATPDCDAEFDNPSRLLSLSAAERDAYLELRQAARELANVQSMHELAKANYMAKLAALNAIIAPVK